jgi:hypothetical protein
MKRLLFPVFLVLASLITAAVFTTVTAVTLASYSKETNKTATVIPTSLDVNHSTVQR